MRFAGVSCLLIALLVGESFLITKHLEETSFNYIRHENICCYKKKISNSL